jgi:iron-desferrioxamine transport system substrate-binding protein
MSPNGLGRPFTRRDVLATGLAAGAAALAGCGSGTRKPSGWTFVDDRKHTVRLGRRPARIVAYSTAAAALYDWGVTPIGVFGTDPREDKVLANLPWDKVQIIGSVYGEIDLEKLRSLKADLIVSRWYPPPTDSPLFGFKTLAQQRMIGAQVPIVGINSHVIATRQIDRFGDLARALGVNTRSGKVADARAAFVRAETNMSRTARRESNLRIIAISADQNSIYVAKVVDSGDLTFYADRGVPLVSAKTSDPYWDTIPWKEAGKYPADGILYDMRQTVFPLSVAKTIRPFAELPAVEAHQVGAWRADPPPSYQAYASRMDELAKTIASWRKVT